MSTNSTPNSPSSPANTSVTIEHRVSQGNNRSRVAGLGMFISKPLIIGAGLYIFAITGSAAYLLSQALRIPGLNNQIEELEFQVDRLEEQVDELAVEVVELEKQVGRLSQENDRYEELNLELQQRNEEFQKQNEILNASLNLFSDLNQQFNGSNVEFAMYIMDLQGENEKLTDPTDALNATAMDLQAEVGRLEASSAELKLANDIFRTRNEELTNETTMLKELTLSLNASVIELGTEVEVISAENDRLAELNTNLGLIVSFLNETAGGIQDDYDAFASALARDITKNRELALGALKNNYQTQVSDWDCDFRDTFIDEPFATDRNLPIGSEKYGEVRGYVETRVLIHLCVDTANIEAFLETRFSQDGSVPPVDNVSVNQLVSGVSEYTADVLDFYFPDPGDQNGGINSSEWADANFDCNNLDRKYAFSS